MDCYSDSDLKDLWDNELDTMHCDSMLRLTGPPTNTHDLPDWFMDRGANDRQVLHVILNDKLMTDALLGGAPIKREHSYSGPEQEKTDENNNDNRKTPLCTATSHSSLSDLELDIKLEPSSCPASPRPAFFPLPPTPPADAAQKYARQPIHTALISQQPKGGVGDLQLTDEEKRTLVAEGYAVPHRMPLTKAEEKSLKKVRRKIKNKISAQESRRKKKEYMDQLERRYERLAAENGSYRQRVETLEDENRSLHSQLQRIQLLVQRNNQ